MLFFSTWKEAEWSWDREVQHQTDERPVWAEGCPAGHRDSRLVFGRTTGRPESVGLHHHLFIFLLQSHLFLFRNSQRQGMSIFRDKSDYIFNFFFSIFSITESNRFEVPLRWGEKPQGGCRPEISQVERTTAGSEGGERAAPNRAGTATRSKNLLLFILFSRVNVFFRVWPPQWFQFDSELCSWRINTGPVHTFVKDVLRKKQFYHPKKWTGLSNRVAWFKRTIMLIFLCRLAWTGVNYSNWFMEASPKNAARSFFCVSTSFRWILNQSICDISETYSFNLKGLMKNLHYLFRNDGHFYSYSPIFIGSKQLENWLITSVMVLWLFHGKLSK